MSEEIPKEILEALQKEVEELKGVSELQTTHVNCLQRDCDQLRTQNRELRAMLSRAFTHLPCTCEGLHSNGHYDYCIKQIVWEALAQTEVKP